MYARSGIVPVRSEARDASEMQTQLLLGETVTVNEIKERWVHITADLDGYSGWVNRNQMRALSQVEYEQWTGQPERRNSPFASFRIHNESESLWVPVGSRVIIEDNHVQIPGVTFNFSDKPRLLRHDSIIETAHEFLGTPYLWGGRTDAGIDCSGFIQTVYGIHGSALPRDSGVQFKTVESYTNDIQEAKPGDIVYFNTGGGSITHVGFFIGDGVILHASGNVKRNRLTKEESEKNTRFPYNQRLAEHIAGIQSGQLLFEFGQKNQKNFVLKQ